MIAQASIHQDRIQHLQSELADLRQSLLAHPVYHSLTHLHDLQVFMEHHVYAVWDFMTLVKSLQIRLTCVRLPWMPPAQPHLARLINEVVLAEESDLDPEGRPASHFDLYYRAMREAGASTAGIDRLLAALREGQPFEQALDGIGEAAAQFVRTTMAAAHDPRPHIAAACFTFGREELIPDLFTQLVRRLHAQFPNQLDGFVYYLDRHIELDGDSHGPLALALVADLCGDDPSRWQQAQLAARTALEARLGLWNAIAHTLAAHRSLN
jgi:hypothetical protein